MTKQIIHVLIAEDMEPIAKRYVRIFSETEDIHVIAEVYSAEEAVIQARKTHPDVILMDIEMESKDAGLKAAKELLAENNNQKIIILTVYEEDELIYTAFQLGVSDYLLKNATPKEVILSIRNVYNGKVSLRPELTTKILGEFKRVKSYESSFLYAVNMVASLTHTELEILDLLLQNKTRREICHIRYVEMSTIKTQIRMILKKFHVKSVNELITWVTSMNLEDFIRRQRKEENKKEYEKGNG